MKIMTWDAALAAQAQQWANTCIFQHSPASQRPIASGENLASRGFFGEINLDVGIDAAERWANERFNIIGTQGLLPFTSVSNSAGVIGHWTAMIWADTNKVTVLTLIGVTSGRPSRCGGSCGLTKSGNLCCQ